MMHVPAVTLGQDLSSSSEKTETVTLTGPELREVVEHACGEARAKAREADGLLRQRNVVQGERDRCMGALAQWRGVDAQRLELVQRMTQAEAERDAPVGRLWVIVGIVSGLVLGGVGGWTLGSL